MSLLRILVLAGLVCSLVRAQSLSPRVFYSDLESGPNSGGENNKGVYVTIYGRNFGVARGSSKVTIGGGEADNYPIWSDSGITFQLGGSARTGPIVVSTSRGASNGIPFTVRPGKIHFVSVNGSDHHDGSFGSPWKTLTKAVTSIRSGDTIYAMDGVSQTAPQVFKAALYPTTGGSPEAYNALVAYPGANVTVGDPSSVEGIRLSLGLSVHGGPYWVFAGLTLRGNHNAVSMTNIHHVRIVGCDISCPNGDGATGCVSFTAGNGIAEHLWFLGNNVHDVSQNLPQGSSKLYHDVYFTTDSNHVVAAWNHIHDSKSCRAIQFHSSPVSNFAVSGVKDKTPLEISVTKPHGLAAGRMVQISKVDGSAAINGTFLVKKVTSPLSFTIAGLDGSDVVAAEPYQRGGVVSTSGFNQFDISIHDNLIHGNACDGINLATVDPSRGPVRIYNNVIYHVGAGPHPHDGVANYACIFVQGGVNRGPAPQGTVEVFNNTCYDAGSADPATAGLWAGPNANSPGFTVRLRNNIFYSINGEQYLGAGFVSHGQPAGLIGSGNLWYGHGSGPAAPTRLTGNVNADPLFLNPAGFDFHLQPRSPAIDAGSATPVEADYDGAPRPQGSAYDAGAFEFSNPSRSRP